MTGKSYETSRRLRERAHALIPGGCHTYAKGDDQYPEDAPGFIARGEGCRVWDVDGNEFIEYGMGLRAVTLGHAHPRTVEAVCRYARLGTNFTRPTDLESQVAEELLDLVYPGNNDVMVKFGKNGSDVVSAAVRLARAVTGRDKVVIANQPFFSIDDWFIGSTPMNSGVPEAVRRLTLGFAYNDLASLKAVLESSRGEVACVIMEAARTDAPAPGFLEGVQNLCREHGALFVLDEMITGFRWHNAGARVYYGLAPDLVCFGKGLGNGFSVSALVGRREYMERGGLRTGDPRVFLLSLTHGAESTGLAAAGAVIATYREEDVIGHLWRLGERLASGLREIAVANGVQDQVEALGPPCNLVFTTRDADGQPSQPLRTLLLQELLERGVLAPSLVVSYSHDEGFVDETLAAFADALPVYRRALEDGVDNYLRGRSVQPVFRRHVGLV
ncbi:MAG: glutamate-1-semialdehyde 2,1-aminomutase [Trueperaceae bacterium]|nr:glutamate-1-semialdehyde 2,1-aminomutase [Trueperaceae bacterium]